MTKPKRQHYIPRVYLKNFTNSNGKVWVYDKELQTLKELSTKDTTIEKELYTITDVNGNKNYFLEDYFGKIETIANPILNKIINKQVISFEDKTKLSLFIALLDNRTVASIKDYDKTSCELLTWMKNMRLYNGEFDSLINNMKCSQEDAKQKIKDVKISLNKETTLKSLIYLAGTFAEYFSLMEWRILYTKNKNCNFITSDNPLFLLPEKISNDYGYGIATQGVQKIIPLAYNIILSIGEVGNIAVHGCVISEKVRVRQINTLSFMSAKRFVISNNKELLENLIKRFHNKCNK